MRTKKGRLVEHWTQYDPRTIGSSGYTVKRRGRNVRKSETRKLITHKIAENILKKMEQEMAQLDKYGMGINPNDWDLPKETKKADLDKQRAKNVDVDLLLNRTVRDQPRPANHGKEADVLGRKLAKLSPETIESLHNILVKGVRDE